MNKNLIYLLILVLISGCAELTTESDIDSNTEASPEWDGVTAATEPIELNEVEITEYQGEKLGSVNDFRENSIKGPQYIDIDDYTIKIDGLVDEEKELTYEDVLNHQAYSKLVTIHCIEGWSVKILWEGVLLKDLFDEVGLSPEANTVIFYAYDGYSTSLPLDYILDNDIILAYKMNNITIPPERGFPFQVVAQDKYGYKWAKWVTRIRVTDNPNYTGFWESRGYDNDADVSILRR